MVIISKSPKIFLYWSLIFLTFWIETAKARKPNCCKIVLEELKARGIVGNEKRSQKNLQELDDHYRYFLQMENDIDSGQPQNSQIKFGNGDNEQKISEDFKTIWTLLVAKKDVPKNVKTLAGF